MPAVRIATSFLPLLAAGWNVACAAETTAPEFEYLRLQDRALVVTHSLASQFEMPVGFTAHPVTHRTGQMASCSNPHKESYLFTLHL